MDFVQSPINQASALVHVYTDGSVSVTTGGVEMGQGLSTKIAAIAAKAFGIGLQRIKIESTNTTRIANRVQSKAVAGAIPMRLRNGIAPRFHTKPFSMKARG